MSEKVTKVVGLVGVPTDDGRIIELIRFDRLPAPVRDQGGGLVGRVVDGRVVNGRVEVTMELDGPGTAGWFHMDLADYTVEVTSADPPKLAFTEAGLAGITVNNGPSAWAQLNERHAADQQAVEYIARHGGIPDGASDE